MTIFKKFYLEGSLSDRMYELIEVKIANKYSIPRNSVFRMYFLLNRHSKEFVIILKKSPCFKNNSLDKNFFVKEYN